ncbi:orotidine-5'-phosphate decarboxylase [Amphibacillus marinus]|uniref:Orotidine 5'-phosphate decarboxylase n=1 Tax=Amphibacillus marinus TaxID=872970 RepID=A0A1H8I050_9BACI|nr:orotidine-5'-phosphate decarboxylase [Amphibacillus marinus]SEN61732.1 orotidine-5'-phosphate decarboxylase [Amphibacillus marinus]
MTNGMYLALDFHSWEEADRFLTVNQLTDIPVKVGMELFYREGVNVVKRLRDRGQHVFLDLKLHDIPTTVYKAMKQIARLDVDYVNVHAFGGREMIKAAKQGLVEQQSRETKLLAVTILTTMDESSLSDQLTITTGLQDTVVQLSKLAQSGGADGVVCSAHEVGQLKAACGDDFLTMTPGIRLDTSAHDDQKRVATPAHARSLGADAIVIGRSITKAAQPRNAYQDALKEWNHD